MGAVVMVLRGRFRQYWKSWLALGVLVAVAAGAVLIAVLASPLTPVGEARLAVPAPGRMSLDWHGRTRRTPSFRGSQPSNS